MSVYDGFVSDQITFKGIKHKLKTLVELIIIMRR